MTPAARRPFLPLVGKALLDTWRSTLVWALVLLSVLALYLPLYPSMAGPGSVDTVTVSIASTGGT